MGIARVEAMCHRTLESALCLSKPRRTCIQKSRAKSSHVATSTDVDPNRDTSQHYLPWGLIPHVGLEDTFG